MIDKHEINSKCDLYKSHNGNLYVVNKYGAIYMMHVGKEEWVYSNISNSTDISMSPLMTSLGTIDDLCLLLAKKLNEDNHD